MSLFRCVDCGVVENTACCGLVWEQDPKDVPGKTRRKLVCSQCNPDIGRWHNFFPRQDADEAGYVQDGDSRYIVRLI